MKKLEFVYKIADQSDSQAIKVVGKNLFDNDIIDESLNEFLDDPRHHLILAYHHSNIVGMGSAFVYIHPDKNPAFFINEVSVLENYRNQNIGTILTKKLIELGKKLACNEIWLATEYSNNSARKAYKKAGGKEDPEPVVLITFN